MDQFCPICTKGIFSHARKLQCQACSVISHLKCVTLISGGDQNCQTYAEWFCQTCLIDIFPFNNSSDDKDLSQPLMILKNQQF